MCRKYTQFVTGKQGQTLAGASVDISWNRCYNIEAVGRERNERTGIGKTVGSARGF